MYGRDAYYRPTSAESGGCQHQIENEPVSKVKIGIVGSRFQADCIATSVKAMPEEAEVVAVASPTPGNAEAFARRHGISAFYSDFRDLLKDRNVEMISITAPNRLHA